MTIWTVGHFTRSADEFISILGSFKVERLVDIRTVPRSARNPQFNSEQLRATLRAAGLDYLHMPGLGGLRHPRKDSTNTAWKNDSFRGYADYMETREFDLNLERLVEIGNANRITIMCAEALPWQCHRSLVSDALVARGVEVLHIMSRSAAKPHCVTSFARIDGPRVSYPGFPVPTVS